MRMFDACDDFADGADLIQCGRNGPKVVTCPFLREIRQPDVLRELKRCEPLSRRLTIVLLNRLVLSAKHSNELFLRP